MAALDRTWRSRAAFVAACAVAGALLSAAPAGAHAFLVRSVPASGGVVRSAPREVRLVFDEPVRPAPGIGVVRAGGHSVTAGKPFVPAGKPNEIVIPLRQGLGNGPYAVHWSEIDEDDGHLISGAFIFAVGGGLPPIHQAAAAGTDGGGPPLSAVDSRWLLLAGLLVAAGAVGFGLLVWRPVLAARASSLAPRRERADAIVLAAALGLGTLGAVLSVVLEPGESGSRFGHWTLIGACVAAAGAAAALASLRVRALRLPAALAAVALLGLPTATGHASAGDVPHALSIPADLVHLAAAAFWLGGLLELAVIAPLVVRGVDTERGGSIPRALARRFAPFAAGAVLLLAASGIVRAVNELGAVDEIWRTGYGQTLLVKTGILAGLVAVAWLNRHRLRRLGLGAELALFAVLIGAVAVLTNLRPGLTPSLAATAQASASSTVVVAAQDRDLAVGLALTPRDGETLGLRATVLGQNGPARKLDVRFVVRDGDTTRRAAAAGCGAGCYAASVPLADGPPVVSAEIAGHGRPAHTLRFAAPAEWPAPQALETVRRAEQTIESLRSLVVHSRLASDPEHEVTTIYRMVAPNRLAYHNVGGSDSVIIGDRRWDRPAAGGRWTKSPQWPPISQPSPFWPPQITDAHVLRTDRVDGHPVWVVSFLDPATPAWFTAWIDRSSFRTLQLEMVAAAHFMHDRDGPFDAPISVEPPGA